MSVVLVTGATGFVAGHVIEDLLDHGYSVRATVREPRDVAGHAHLLEIAQWSRGTLEIVAAELDSDAGWDVVMSGCEFVLHIASPVPMKSDDAALTATAVGGTVRVLSAAARTATVRRVVLTSSTVAIDSNTTTETLTDKDWADLDSSDAYARSKILAERKAWEYVRGLGSGRGLELTTILPGNVLGPLQRRMTVTSHTAVRKLLEGSLPGLIRIGWPIVDVRDLAAAHRLAMEVPAAAGQRYVCAGQHVWMSDLAAILAEEFGPQGFQMPQRVIPDWLVRIASHFDRELKLALPSLGRSSELNGQCIQHELGIEFRPASETVIETGNSLIDYGIVRRQRFARAQTV